jgi:hypothetical protein
MYKIPLTSIPNQAVSFNLDGAFWKIHIFQAVDRMYMDISRGGEVIILGSRCLGGIPLMPYTYMFAPNFGNFIFDSDADWTLFGDSCNLFYLPSAEYAEYAQLAGL